MENPRACYEPAHADARLLDRGSSKTKPRSCGNQPAHESLLNRRLSALPPAVDVVQKHSAWAEPECRRLLKALDGEHESRLLKKSLRLRNEGVQARFFAAGCGSFSRFWPDSRVIVLSLFMLLDALRPSGP